MKGIERMSLVAGTIMVVQDGMPYYLVDRNEAEFNFLAAKMHEHEGDTALGTILKELANTITVDELRLEELTSVETSEGTNSLFVFTTVNFDNIDLDDSSLEFVQAAGLHELLETVDMGSAPQLM
jgi:hypothetical protein